jgi:DNA helicase-2/ATP-dependent DNA helicase PcrA
VRLERNYRSTNQILNLAGTVVANNKGRLGKTLQAERGGGKSPTLVFVPDQESEADFCRRCIERSVDDMGGNYNDWAILYRTNAQSLGFETEFLRNQIPYRVVGSLKFYQREEIKDALSLLALLLNPRDEVAFKRMVNKPARGLGETTIIRVIDNAVLDLEGNLLQSLEVLSVNFSQKARTGAQQFLQAINKTRSMLENNEKIETDEFETASGKVPVMKLRGAEGLSVMVAYFLEKTGVAEHHRANDEAKAESRTANLQELVNAASLYPLDISGLTEFLEHIELDRSIEAKSEDNPDAVTLITLHNTKGLEYNRVIITGVEQGIFPRYDKTGFELEEERRLFYVGVTRAMDELYLTCAEQRRVYGHTQSMEPSIFLRESRKVPLKVLGDVPYGFRT